MIGNRIGVNYEPPEKTNFPIGSGKMPVYATVGSAIMDLMGKKPDT